MANTRGRIVFGVLVALLGSALFVITSAYVVDHGYLKIGGAIAGALAFPVVPVLWHFLGERRRRARLAARKQAPKATLTGYDRFWLRFAVVAIAALAPMFAKSGTGVLGAVRRHGLWFVPSSPPGLTQQLERVPSDAELAVVITPPPDDGKPAGSAVLAWGAGQAMLAADAVLEDQTPDEQKLEAVRLLRDRFLWAHVPELDQVKTSDHSFVVASAAWRTQVEAGGAGPGPELHDELARAPAGAPFIAAFAPRTKVDEVRHGVIWAELSDKSFTVAGHLEARDAMTATKLAGELSALVHSRRDDLPEACREPLTKLVDQVKVEVIGAEVTARAELPRDLLGQLETCAMPAIRP